MRCGKWTIRQSLAFMDTVDMAIGPETGVINTASMLPYPKVVLLSHSTHENLTRDWVNVHPVQSENTVCPGRGNNEAPACHQMHYSFQYCKPTADKVAQCQADISADQVYRKVWHCITELMEQAA
jgi:ADP-heptose:LPS heptosyltransferase